MVINSTIKNKMPYSTYIPPSNKNTKYLKKISWNKWKYYFTTSQLTVSTSVMCVCVWSLCPVSVSCACLLSVSCVCLLSARGVWRVPVVLSGRSGIYTHTDPSQWSNKGQISKKKNLQCTPIMRLGLWFMTTFPELTTLQSVAFMWTRVMHPV